VITAPITNIYDYFDHHDVHMHGSGIIHAVLNAIALENADRTRAVHNFVFNWMSGHMAQLHNNKSNTQDLFGDEEKTHFDESFLKEAFDYLEAIRSTMPPAEAAAQNIPG
jgi:hypothetical protein